MAFNKLFGALALAATAVFATQANASVIDTEIANLDRAVDENTSVNFTHDFTDKGFVLGSNQYISGTLVVRLTDLVANEDGRIYYGAQYETTGNIANQTQDEDSPAGTFFTITLNAAALIDLNTDGILAMSIVSTDKAFYFADSTLTLQERTAVPEPLSISLLAAGMVGFCASRRRPRKA